jgi:replication factor A1
MSYFLTPLSQNRVLSRGFLLLLTISMSQLSAGICTRLVNASPDDNALFNAGHTVQFVSIKNVSAAASSNPSNDRFRIVFSDGEHALQAMLATQLNSLVIEGHIVKNAVVVIEKLTSNYVQGKR